MLSKDPKFSLKYDLKEITFSTETERMNSKVRYDLGLRKRKNKYSGMITDTEGKSLDTTQCKAEKLRDVSDNENISEELLGAFMEARHGHIYDPLNKTMSFIDRKPTDYKLNKRVILPKALDSDKEFQCGLKRLEYIKALKEYDHEIRLVREKMKKKKKRSFLINILIISAISTGEIWGT